MSAMRQYFASSIENVRLAFVSLLSNRLRAVLTTIGITIGVSSVIVLLSVGRAFENFLIGQFNSVGTNLVAVFGEQGERGEFTPLTQSDLDALSDPSRVSEALFVTAFVQVSAEANYGDRSTEPQILGVNETYLEVDSREVIAGRYLDDRDVSASSRVAVLGASAVDNLFPSNVYPIGETIRVSGVPFEVIGVMSEAGSGGFIDQDNSLFVPISTAQSRLTSRRSVGGDLIVDQIIAKARDENSINNLVTEITSVLREEHDIEFAGEDDFTISTQDDLLDSIGTILRLLTYFLAAIASISLLVGGIGIMNIMLVSVTERTKEIGLRKAVGAQQSDILLQFVTEAVLLSLVGGGAGIAIAASGGALVTALVPDLNVGVDPLSVMLAVGISTAIGVFFGFFPAQRAARLNPIDALRYE